MNLSSTYLGLALAHPFIAGASPLSHHLDTVKRVEDGGAAAIVMHSLFEEQITLERSRRIHHMDPEDEEFASLLAAYPPPERYAFAVDEYLEHIRRVKRAVAIPVIGSLNGVTREAWLNVAREIEQAGADALELNMYEVAADPADSASAIEARIRDVTGDLKSVLSIPVAVKLSPFFTAFGHVARSLDSAGADGLVLFNRFYQPDIDPGGMTVVPRLELSTSAELLLRLRWIAKLHGRVRASLALTGGVATPEDGVKGILAGADAVQLVSAILRNGPAFFDVMRKGLIRWMDVKGLTSIDEARGRVRVDDFGDPGALERATYLRTLQSWPAVHCGAGHDAAR
jgi:dihydroorotate dehydrogenase (fumarate)